MLVHSTKHADASTDAQSRASVNASSGQSLVALDLSVCALPRNEGVEPFWLHPLCVLNPKLNRASLVAPVCTRVLFRMRISSLSEVLDEN